MLEGSQLTRFRLSLAIESAPRSHFSRINHRQPFVSGNSDALPAARGLLRKGRAIFRREDRVDRFAVAWNVDRFAVTQKNVRKFKLRAAVAVLARPPRR